MATPGLARGRIRRGHRSSKTHTKALNQVGLVGPGTDQKFGFWGGPSSVQLELELPELELSSSEVQFEFEFSSI